MRNKIKSARSLNFNLDFRSSYCCYLPDGQIGFSLIKEQLL
ncbi:hypothetical protein KKC1_12770 [Calderihabitans maritimus]|uniref:Uncharacterized protein n=1 Tax=Calderihabitans maritimus TaxID=1246530 RepID=A0A1Z5HRQ1_9FIRM|nr:hypothetical protein KKC1_12770 [Calderihabitans maritimus]